MKARIRERSGKVIDVALLAEEYDDAVIEANELLNDGEECLCILPE